MWQRIVNKPQWLQWLAEGFPGVRSVVGGGSVTNIVLGIGGPRCFGRLALTVLAQGPTATS